MGDGVPHLSAQRSGGSCVVSDLQRGERQSWRLRNGKPSSEKLDKESCVVLWLPDPRGKHLPTSMVREEEGARNQARKGLLWPRDQS